MNTTAEWTTLLANETLSTLAPSDDTFPYDNQPFFQVKLAYISVLVFFGAFICSGGGIGGGGVFVPSFILGLGLSAHWALPLSQVTILGVGLGSATFLLPRRHPTLNRRLIDMNLAALLEPATLLGTIPGVLLNIVFPAYIITILLVLLLAFTAYATLKKGIQQKRLEDATRAALAAAAEKASVLPPPHPAASVQNYAPSERIAESAPLLQPRPAEPLSGTEVAHDGVWRWYQIGALFLSCAVLAATLAFKDRFVCGTWQYWALTAAPVPVIGFLCVYFALQPPKRSRFPWIWSVAGLTAGGVAGFLGIGGGMVKSPLMISMGTTPQVATATASFMILFTSAATTLQFFLLKRLRWEFALWYGGVGMVGSFLGQFVLARVVTHYNRQSWVSFFVGFVIVGCAIAMVATNVINIVDKKSPMNFSSICGAANATQQSHNATSASVEYFFV
jgi:uncharacterized membrane protein YfcA